MKSNLIVLLCLCISFSVFAQSNTAYDALLTQLSFESPSFSKAAKGSPLLNEDWQLGSLQLPNQVEKIDLSLNLDLVNQLVIVKLKDGRTGYLSADKATQIVFNEGGIEKNFQPMTIDGDSHPHFYQILKEGNFSFFKKTGKVLRANGKGHATYGYDRAYLVKGPDSKFMKVDLSLESLEKGLPQYAGQIESISKDLAKERIMEKEVIEILNLLEQRG